MSPEGDKRNRRIAREVAREISERPDFDLMAPRFRMEEAARLAIIRAAGDDDHTDAADGVGSTEPNWGSAQAAFEEEPTPELLLMRNGGNNGDSN